MIGITWDDTHPSSWKYINQTLTQKYKHKKVVFSLNVDKSMNQCENLREQWLE